MKPKLFCILVLIFAGVSVQSASSSLSQNTTLQPGPGSNDGTDDGSLNKGKDSSHAFTGNGAASEVLSLYNSPCNLGLWPGYIQFSTADMPTQVVARAEVQVYCKMYFNGFGWAWQVQAYQLSARQVTAPWDELHLPASVAPSPLSSNILHTVGNGTPGFVEFEGWLGFDITGLYREWAAGITPNYGLQFAIDTTYCANGDEFIIYSSDYPDAELRPKLVVASPSLSPTLTIAVEGANALLSWDTFSNVTYQVETSGSLTNWSGLGTPFLGQGGLTNVVAPMTNSPAFFRVVVP